MQTRSQERRKAHRKSLKRWLHRLGDKCSLRGMGWKERQRGACLHALYLKLPQERAREGWIQEGKCKLRTPSTSAMVHEANAHRSYVSCPRNPEKEMESWPIRRGGRLYLEQCS